MTSLRLTMLGRAALGPTFSPTKARIGLRGVHMSAQANSSLTKQELIDIVSTKSGVKKESVKSVLESLTDSIVNAVAQDQKVTIVGFGSFEKNLRSARKGRNPATGAEIDIPEKAVPVFKAGKAFKDSVAASK
ncbi:hypothetical protein Ndes2526B_g04712 [Nannochloris sp. 'desiccata']|nr:hypothetical protein KSW81_000570 [Chlorella desiccata (nom. nud.)]KAH7615706.1 putative DNA-binding protein HU [Chlorella desiccata (nom. nud.)]KAH7620785.1 putative DNA-binding protein HU [Chlorella desiccata (nom. nud.)]